MKYDKVHTINWKVIEKQIGKPKTIDDYRRTYKIINGKLVETTPDLPHKTLAS